MITCTFEDGNKTTNLRHMVVHAIVEKDGAILLVKRAPPLLEAGKWGLPAGFMDRDETAKECCLRELKEETGWEGEIITLFRINSNPNRPHEDRQNVSIEFLVKPLQKTGEPDHESTAVEWIPIEKLLPFDQFAFDHGESIRLFTEYRKNAFGLPLLE
jgi:8-oxo-dGTP diphosphatase